MMRQIGEQILTIVGAMALWAVLFAAPAFADHAVDTQPSAAELGEAAPAAHDFITDPLTGVAIDGFDPVTYFANGEARTGKPDYEYHWAGVPWYFESAANRDVFMRAPEVYAPQSGGHCQMSLARGYLSDGKPRLYAIVDGKLYFFYSTANRDAFLISPQAAIKSADANWNALSRTDAANEPQLPGGGQSATLGN